MIDCCGHTVILFLSFGGPSVLFFLNNDYISVDFHQQCNARIPLSLQTY